MSLERHEGVVVMVTDSDTAKAVSIVFCDYERDPKGWSQGQTKTLVGRPKAEQKNCLL
jgi:hypothetical protein